MKGVVRETRPASWWSRRQVFRVAGFSDAGGESQTQGRFGGDLESEVSEEGKEEVEGRLGESSPSWR